MLIALAGSKYFKVDTLLAVLCCCALVNPSWGEIAGRIATGESLTFMMLPLAETTYTSTVLPPIIVLALLVYVERFFKSHLPEVLQPIFVPLCSYLIMVPATLLVVGPITSGVAHGLSTAFQAFYTHLPWLCAMVFGAFWQVFVMFGLHWGLIPIMINNITVYGFDPLVVTYFGCSFAQIGVVLGIFLRTKDAKLKSISLPAFISGIFGVTEPCIYGVTLPRKKYFIISCIGGAIGGALMALLSVKLFMFGGLGIFGYPTFIDTQTGDLSGMYGGMIASAVSFAFGLIVTAVLYKDAKPAEAAEKLTVIEEKDGRTAEREVIKAPLAGSLVALEDVADEAFATGVLGKGIAIDPSDGRVVAPADCTVMTLFPTAHAIGLITDKGTELLIHIGMDTVKLEGQHFTAKVKQGEHVKAGQTLIEFDAAAIRAAGYDVTTPVLVTNTDQYMDIVTVTGQEIKEEENLLTVIA